MAFQDLIKYGVNTQGDRFAGLGEAAQQGFLEGEARLEALQDRAFVEDERKRIADEREQKELDAFYGDLYVPPTGQVSYDAGVEMMGREWKAEYAALNAAKKAGQISNEDYVAQKHSIRNRAQELKAGQEALNMAFQTYQKGLSEGMISDSTPAKTKLFYQALEDGNLQIENVNGRPTLIGQVADGEPVQIDMAALASGQAGLKFNQKVDTVGLVDQVAKTLEGYKTTIATENGLSIGNVGWPQIQERAAHDIDQLINNESTVQAIAADDLGLNSEQIVALGAEEVKNRVGDYLLDKVHREYFPTERIDKFTGLTDYQAGQLARPRGGGAGGGPTAAQLEAQQREQIAQSIAQINPAGGGLAQLSGLGGYTVEYDDGGWFGSEGYTIIDAKGNKQKLPPAEAKNFLQNTLVGAPAQGGGPVASESDPLGLGLGGDAPIKRNGPDKKKKGKKKAEFSAYAPGYTKHFSKGSGAYGDLGNIDPQRFSNRGYNPGLLGSEGGQGGVLGSVRFKNPEKKGGTVITAGALRNSYGDPIAALTAGREWNLGKKGRTKVGIQGGATYGYGKSFNALVDAMKAETAADPTRGYSDGRGGFTEPYARGLDKGIYKTTRETNLTPIVTGTIEHDLGGDPNRGFGLKALVNPLYVNAGVSYKFGKKKKKKKK